MVLGSLKFPLVPNFLAHTSIHPYPDRFTTTKTKLYYFSMEVRNLPVSVFPVPPGADVRVYEHFVPLRGPELGVHETFVPLRGPELWVYDVKV